jgi:hypothetical protein
MKKSFVLKMVEKRKYWDITYYWSEDWEEGGTWVDGMEPKEATHYTKKEAKRKLNRLIVGDGSEYTIEEDA